MRLSRLAISAGLVLVGAKASLAQATPDVSKGYEIAGKTSMDLIIIEANNPSVPLRNAGVIPRSETLDLDGRRLVQGKDYSIDYGTGMVYLMGQLKVGQALRAAYTYDPARAQTQAKAGTNSFGINGFKLDFNGGTSVMMGLGLAERKADGTMTRKNIFGLKNNFGAAGGLKLTGLIVGADAKRVSSFNLMGPKQAKNADAEGSSQAMVEQLSSNLLGGKATVDFQEVGRKFTAFNAFSDAGFSDAVVNALKKEAGLKRTGFTLDKIGNAGLNLSANVRTVRDGKETIDWRNYGAQLGGLTLGYSQSEVGSGFKRFNDLADADNQWLAREKGLKKTVTTLGWAGIGLKLSGQNSDVVDQKGNEVVRQTLSAALGTKGNFAISTQKVDKGFSQFGGLRDADAGQLAREQGLSRQNLSLDYTPVANSWKVQFAQSWVKNDSTEAKFQNDRIALSNKKYDFERVILDSTKGFSSLGNFAEPEIQGHLQTISKMYDRNGFGFDYGQERGIFVNNSGIKRELNRFNADIGKGGTLQFDQLTLTGSKDRGELMSLALNGKNFKFKHNAENMGTGFVEAASLANFEKARLGGVAGLEKRDDSLALDMGKGKQLNVSSMEASKPGEGEVKRDSVNYTGNGLNVSYTNRDVSKSFSTVNQLPDIERDLLNGMKGYVQKDMRISYTGYRGVSLNMIRTDALNKDTDEDKSYAESTLNWQLDKLTKFAYFKRETSDMLPGQKVFENITERFDFAHQFGKLGAVALVKESNTYDGSATKAPSSERLTWSATVNVSQKTALTTEHTQTDFSDGTTEKIHTNTISTQLNGRTGVSMSEVQVRRDGTKADEERQDYGFYYDFGKGLRLNYGFKRDLNSTRNDQARSSVGMTAGEAGNIKVDSLTYGENVWENQRFQDTGNVALGLIKPIRFGPFSNLMFRMSADTARDNGRFQKENRVMNGSAKLGSNLIGYDYFSQVAPTGERAIDRTFRFATDPNSKSTLKASMLYKVRTMPSDKTFAIRNFDLSWSPYRSWTLSHQLQTNPEVARGDLLLGTLPQASRTSKWKLDFGGTSATKFGLTWDELLNDANGARSRVGGVTMTLNAKNPSPVSLWYGFEYNHQGALQRTAHRYSLKYDQRPGENQLFSLFLGNVSWEHSHDATFQVQNWSARAEWQLKW